MRKKDLCLRDLNSKKGRDGLSPDEVDLKSKDSGSTGQTYSLLHQSVEQFVEHCRIQHNDFIMFPVTIDPKKRVSGKYDGFKQAKKRKAFRLKVILAVCPSSPTPRSAPCSDSSPSVSTFLPAQQYALSSSGNLAHQGE